jgi:hypothetical protein
MLDFQLQSESKDEEKYIPIPSFYGDFEEKSNSQATMRITRLSIWWLAPYM